MSDDDRPPGGLPWHKAVRKFADPELLAAHDRAYYASGRRPGRNLRIHTVSQEGIENWPKSLDQDYDKARKALYEHFLGLIKPTGEVISFGHPGSVGEPAKEIPPGEWRWLPTAPCADGATFKGHGRTWYRVEFYRREDVVEWRQRSAKHDGRASKSSAVNACRRWLSELREAGPEKGKPDYRQTACGKFEGLSERGFNQAWATAVGDDARWTKPGPKPKAPKA